MKRVIILLLAVLSVNVVSIAEDYPATLDEAMEMLDDVIAHKDEYIKLKQEQIDSVKAQLKVVNGRETLNVYERLGDEYRRFNIDSALYYYNAGRELAFQLGDSVMAQRFGINWASLLPVLGVVQEALDEYEAINQKNLYKENRAVYYEAGNQLYYFLTSFYPIPRTKYRYNRLALEMTDSLVACLPDNSPKANLYKSQILLPGEQALMIAMLNDILATTSMSDNLFARAASQLAANENNRNGATDKYLYYMMLSAIADIKGGTLEGTALQRLGVVLHNRGDIDRAYACLTLSLENAVGSRSRIRALESAEAMPIILQAFQNKDAASRERMQWLIVALAVALAIIIAVLVFLRFEIKKLHKLKSRLAEANVMKETYISRFLSLSSIYIDKLEEFHRVARRKIKAGQVADLFEMLQSEKMLAEQSEIFYEVFDNAFVHIYPMFVDEVNALLLPDKRIERVSNERTLTPELRILAFMRLGINDSQQIARFLGLSLNTVYTYRNKLKGRAKNRDRFEADVMKIGVINA